MAGKVPNSKLVEWLERSGFSRGELARKVNKSAAARGMNQISTDTSRVRRWLEGEHPQHPVPAILSAIFTERFGYAVSVEDLGLRREIKPALDGMDIPWELPRLIESIGNFTRSDLMLARRNTRYETSAVITGVPLIEPLRRRLSGGPTPLAGQPNSRQISASEIAKVEAAADVFRNWDNPREEGLPREAVVAQVKVANDLLRQRSYTGPHGRRLLSTIADLATLAGWMALDTRLHRTAQIYFGLGFAAATAAGDDLLVAAALVGMSRQMAHLKHSSDALELIWLAQHGTPATPIPAIRAMLLLNEAGIYADLGDIQACSRAAAAAEDVVAARGDPVRIPALHWLRWLNRADLAALAGGSYRVLAGHDPWQLQRVAIFPRSSAGLTGLDDATSHPFATIEVAAGFRPPTMSGPERNDNLTRAHPAGPGKHAISGSPDHHSHALDQPPPADQDRQPTCCP